MVYRAERARARRRMRLAARGHLYARLHGGAAGERRARAQPREPRVRQARAHERHSRDTAELEGGRGGGRGGLQAVGAAEGAAWQVAPLSSSWPQTTPSTLSPKALTATCASMTTVTSSCATSRHSRTPGRWQNLINLLRGANEPRRGHQCHVRYRQLRSAQLIPDFIVGTSLSLILGCQPSMVYEPKAENKRGT